MYVFREVSREFFTLGRFNIRLPCFLGCSGLSFSSVCVWGYLLSLGVEGRSYVCDRSFHSTKEFYDFDVSLFSFVRMGRPSSCRKVFTRYPNIFSSRLSHSSFLPYTSVHAHRVTHLIRLSHTPTQTRTLPSLSPSSVIRPVNRRGGPSVRRPDDVSRPTYRHPSLPSERQTSVPRHTVSVSFDMTPPLWGRGNGDGNLRPFMGYERRRWGSFSFLSERHLVSECRFYLTVSFHIPIVQMFYPVPTKKAFLY